MFELSGALLGSRSMLDALHGLPAFAVPSPCALVQLTALQSLSLVGPVQHALGLPMGLRFLHMDAIDDVKASPVAAYQSRSAQCPQPGLCMRWLCCCSCTRCLTYC